MKNIKEKIIEILRDVISASDNRDWDREAHATKQELKIMRKNNDNNFEIITDQILDLFVQEKEKLLRPIEKRLIEFEDQLPLHFLAEIWKDLEKLKKLKKNKLY